MNHLKVGDASRQRPLLSGTVEKIPTSPDQYFASQWNQATRNCSDSPLPGNSSPDLTKESYQAGSLSGLNPADHSQNT